MGITSVIGNRDGVQYTTTLTKHTNDFVQTTSQFATNLGKEALIAQIKELRRSDFQLLSVFFLLIQILFL